MKPKTFDNLAAILCCLAMILFSACSSSHKQEYYYSDTMSTDSQTIDDDIEESEDSEQDSDSDDEYEDEESVGDAYEEETNGLLYEGYYTYGDGIDVATGTVMSDVHSTNRIEIYEDRLKDLNEFGYERTTDSGTRIYSGSDAFGNPTTYYVSSNFNISIVMEMYSQWGHNTIRTELTKGDVVKAPALERNYGGSYGSNSSYQQSSYDSYGSSSNSGLTQAQYQSNYQGFEYVVKGVLRSYEINPDMGGVSDATNRRTLRDAQSQMRRIRSEAAQHGITIPQSSYETISIR